MPKVEKTKIETLISTILLNRILQTVRSPARKTHEQIAKKHNCSISRVVELEQKIMILMRKKSAILNILITTKWNE